MPYSFSFLILRMFHYNYDKTQCLFQVVSRNVPSLAILGELHVLKLLCFLDIRLFLFCKGQNDEHAPNPLQGSTRTARLTWGVEWFCHPRLKWFDLLKCVWSCFGNFNHKNISHFHNIITNFKLKSKNHCCKDSKAISDLGAFSLGHKDIQHTSGDFS